MVFNAKIAGNLVAIFLLFATQGCDYIDTLVEADLSSRVAYEGVLLDSISQKPLRAITVEIGSQTATTNDIGYFQFAEIKTGIQSIHFSAEGFVTKSAVCDIKLKSDSLPVFKLPDTRPRADSLDITYEFKDNFGYGQIKLHFSDPDSNMSIIMVDWGDGLLDTFPGQYNEPSFSFYLSHGYNSAGVYHIVIRTYDFSEQFTSSTYPIAVTKRISPKFGSIYVSPDTLRSLSTDSLFILVGIVEANVYIKEISLQYNVMIYVPDTSIVPHSPFTVKLKDVPDILKLGIQSGSIEPGGSFFRFSIPSSNLPFDNFPVDTNNIRISVVDAENKRSDTLIQFLKIRH